MCPSGLRSTLGKRVCGQPYRRFESSRFRHESDNIKRAPVKGGLFYMFDLWSNEDSSILRRRKKKTSFLLYSSLDANPLASAMKAKLK